MPLAPAISPAHEYVAGGAGPVLPDMAIALSGLAGELTQRFGHDVHDRMMRDGAVAGAVDTLSLAALASGIRVMPAVEMPRAPSADPAVIRDAELARDLANFCLRNVRRLEDAEQTIQDVLLELMQAIAYGWAVAEPVLADGDRQDAGKLILRRLAPKPRGNIAILLDGVGELVGYLAVRPGDPLAMTLGGTLPLAEIQQHPGFLPVTKLVRFTFRPPAGDLRGRSMLDPAYNPWYVKTTVWPDYYKYLRQFGTPIVVGKTAPNAPDQPKLDESGAPVGDLRVPAQEAMKGALLSLANSFVVVVPAGAEVQFLQSIGGGEAFINAGDYFDRQIVIAIHGSTRLQMESQHGSRADSNTAQDVVGLRIAYLKGWVSGNLTRFFRWLVRLNYGEASRALAPSITLSPVEMQDKPRLIEAYARGYQGGLFHASQLPGIYRELDAPDPDWEEMAGDREEERLARAHARAEMARLSVPTGLPDEAPDSEP